MKKLILICIIIITSVLNSSAQITQKQSEIRTKLERSECYNLQVKEKLYPYPITTNFISFDVNLGNLTNEKTNEFRFTSKIIGTVGSTFGHTINRSMTIGLTGNYYFDSPVSNLKNFGYFGVLLEPTIFPKSSFHITIPCVVAFYGARSKSFWNSQFRELPDYSQRIVIENAWDNWKVEKLILMSGIRMELNVFKGLNILCGPSYKWIPDQELTYISLDFSIKIKKDKK